MEKVFWEIIQSKYTQYSFGWLLFHPYTVLCRNTVWLNSTKRKMSFVFTHGQASKTNKNKNKKTLLCCGSCQVKSINKRRWCPRMVQQLNPVLSFRCEIQFTERAYVPNIRLQFKWRLVLISGFHWNADLQLSQPWGREMGNYVGERKIKVEGKKKEAKMMQIHRSRRNVTEKETEKACDNWDYSPKLHFEKLLLDKQQRNVALSGSITSKLCLQDQKQAPKK